MKFTLVAIVVYSALQLSHGQTAWQLGKKFKRLECAPKTGYEHSVQPCYDFITKKLVSPDECTLLKYQHCCIHDCACVMRGAGYDAPDVPKRFAKPSPIKKSATVNVVLLEGCTPGEEKPAPSQKTTPKRRRKWKPRRNGNGKVTKKPTRKWAPKTTPKIPSRKWTPKMTTKKPWVKPRRRKTTVKPTPVPTTKKTTTKPCNNSESSLNIFSQFSDMFSQFGFDAGVDETDC